MYLSLYSLSAWIIFLFSFCLDYLSVSQQQDVSKAFTVSVLFGHQFYCLTKYENYRKKGAVTEQKRFTVVHCHLRHVGIIPVTNRHPILTTPGAELVTASQSGAPICCVPVHS